MSTFLSNPITKLTNIFVQHESAGAAIEAHSDLNRLKPAAELAAERGSQPLARSEAKSVDGE